MEFDCTICLRFEQGKRHVLQPLATSTGIFMTEISQLTNSKPKKTIM